METSMGDIFNLSGRVAIVTGGSRGIGKMIATEFVKRGVKVYITARKAEPVLQPLKNCQSLVNVSHSLIIYQKMKI